MATRKAVVDQLQFNLISITMFNKNQRKIIIADCRSAWPKILLKIRKFSFGGLLPTKIHNLFSSLIKATINLISKRIPGTHYSLLAEVQCYPHLQNLKLRPSKCNVCFKINSFYVKHNNVTEWYISRLDFHCFLSSHHPKLQFPNVIIYLLRTQITIKILLTKEVHMNYCNFFIEFLAYMLRIAHL